MEPAPTSNVTKAVFEDTMDKVDGFIALASSRYGERTCNPACTYYEVEEWQRKCFLDASKPAVMLVRCIPVDKAFHKRAVEARQLFSNDANELYALWDSKEPRKVPDEVINLILDRLNLPGHLPSCPYRKHKACSCGRKDVNKSLRNRAVAWKGGKTRQKKLGKRGRVLFSRHKARWHGV